MNSDQKGEPGFASRWSRLKQEAKTESVEAEAEAEVAEPEAPVDDAGPDDRSDEEVLKELGLPDPDTLKAGDNFTAFMAKAVPARLRNRALRKLWISDPVLANLDELLDYGEDFTDAATVVENLQTAYQVGKGFIDKVTGSPEEELKAEAEAEGADKGADEGAGEPPEEPHEEPSGEPVETGEETVEETGGETGADDAAPADVADRVTAEHGGEKAVPAESFRPRKRMRFRLTEDAFPPDGRIANISRINLL